MGNVCKPEGSLGKLGDLSRPENMFLSRGEIFAPWKWNEGEMLSSRNEVMYDIRDDKQLNSNLQKEFEKVRLFLAELELGQYYENFKASRVIFDDIPDLPEMLGEEGIAADLIQDATDRERFLVAVLKMKEESGSRIAPLSLDTSEPIFKVGKAEKEEEKEKKETMKDLEDKLDKQEAELEGEEDEKSKHRFSSEEWYLDKRLLIQGDIIARGSYGVIRRGILRIGLFKVAVAVKEQVVQEEDDEEETMREILLMSQFNHANVVKCFGGFYENSAAYMCEELCSHGDLDVFMKKEGKNLSVKAKLEILKQVSAGMEYIHSVNVVHRDLKPKNVLVKGKPPNYRIKICDFGTSKKVSELDDSVGGTVLYMPPEFMEMEPKKKKKKKSTKKKTKKKGKRKKKTKTGTRSPSESMRFKGEKKLTKEEDAIMRAKKMDVYSFGITCWEMWTGEMPFNEQIKECENEFILFKMIHQNNIRPDLDKMKDAPRGLKDLINCCWDEDLEVRPSAFEEISDELDEVMRAIDGGDSSDED